MWPDHQRQLNQDLSKEAPPQTGDHLPPFGKRSSSSLSKLPVKRSLYSVRSQLLDDDDDDDDDDVDGFQYTPTEQEMKQFNEEVAPDPRQVVLLPLPAPPVQEAGVGLPAESNTNTLKNEKHKKYRVRKKLEKVNLENRVKELENVVEELKLENAKQEVYKAQNAELSAELESARINAAKMEDNVAKSKMYEDQRKQALPCLFKLIQEGGRCNIDKEELWAQLCCENGKQNFEKYWEENKKYKNGLLNQLEKLLFNG